MLRLFSPVRLLVAGLLVAAVALALWVFPTESYIFLPTARSGRPARQGRGRQGPEDAGASTTSTCSFARRRRGAAVPGLREGATVVPAARSTPSGVSEGERRQEQLHEMQMSQQVAAAVALRELGYKVEGQADRRADRDRRPDDAGGREAACRRHRHAGRGKPVTGPADLRAAIRETGTGRGRAARREARRRARSRSRVPREGRNEGTPIIGVASAGRRHQAAGRRPRSTPAASRPVRRARLRPRYPRGARTRRRPRRTASR